MVTTVAPNQGVSICFHYSPLFHSLVIPTILFQHLTLLPRKTQIIIIIVAKVILFHVIIQLCFPERHTSNYNLIIYVLVKAIPMLFTLCKK